MRKTILAALAAVILGSTALSGCYIGPPWWDGDHDEGWHHRGGERWERHGALMPQDGSRRGGPTSPGDRDDNGVG